jgi:hypothetical protein
MCCIATPPALAKNAKTVQKAQTPAVVVLNNLAAQTGLAVFV